MSISRALSRTLLSLVAACSVLAAAPSQAAVVASFDPAFGLAIPNLGFKGTITLDVDPSCYGTTGYSFIGESSCTVSPLSAHIDFYNSTTDPLGTNILSFVDLLDTDFPSFYVSGIYIDPLTGQLTAFDTYDSDLFGVSVHDTTNALATIDYDGIMALYFTSDQIPVTARFASFAVAAAAPTVPGTGGAFLRNCTDTVEGSCISDDDNTSNPGTLRFTTVPEPDSIALSLIGLGALGFTLRRRKAAR